VISSDNTHAGVVTFGDAATTGCTVSLHWRLNNICN
jgi:hypothetical protein